MVIGVVLDYFLLPSQHVAGYKVACLFIGVVIGFSAILTLASADSQRVKLTSVPLDESKDISKSPMISSSVETGNSEVLPATGAASQKVQTSHKNSNAWVYITLIAGLVTSLWSPISNLGVGGVGGVKNPYLRSHFSNLFKRINVIL